MHAACTLHAHCMHTACTLPAHPAGAMDGLAAQCTLRPRPRQLLPIQALRCASLIRVRVRG
eukprot:scaffold48631_cov64-Phaeocystis_antarctica.AAC.2